MMYVMFRKERDNGHLQVSEVQRGGDPRITNHVEEATKILGLVSRRFLFRVR